MSGVQKTSAFALTDEERETLQEAIRTAWDAKSVKRAQALLAFVDGEERAEIARRAGVTVTTIYQWTYDFSARRSEPIEKRLKDRRRSSRPSVTRNAVGKRLATLMEQSPHDSGYRHTTWTTPLLKAHLVRSAGIRASDATIRRALHGMGYRWKRPRFVLSRRPTTWRQSKEGSSAV